MKLTLIFIRKHIILINELYHVIYVHLMGTVHQRRNQPTAQMINHGQSGIKTEEERKLFEILFDHATIMINIPRNTWHQKAYSPWKLKSNSNKKSPHPVRYHFLRSHTLYGHSNSWAKNVRNRFVADFINIRFRVIFTFMPRLIVLCVSLAHIVVHPHRHSMANSFCNLGFENYHFCAIAVESQF